MNARYSHPNLALRYLKSYVRDLDYSCIIKEYSLKAQQETIINEIIKENPLAAALSVYIWNVELVKKIIPELKNKAPQITLILGGPEVSYDPEAWIKDFPEADYIICGSGEAGFRSLLENDLKLDGPIIKVQNPEFSQIPFPYEHDDLISLKNRYLYFESSRGCPYKCTYCISSRSEQKLEYRDFNLVKSELDMLMSYGPDYIKFVDRTFNADKAKSRTIWSHILSQYSTSSTSFHFEINPALLSDEDITLLKACPPGLFQFEAGIQSINPETLQAIHRLNSWEKTKPLLEKLIELKTIHIHLDLIAGLPFEGLHEIRKSFNEVYSLGAHHFQLGFLKILKGTEIKAYADSNKYMYALEAPYQVIQTPWLSSEEIKKLEVIAHFIEHLYNSHLFTLTLQNLADEAPSPFDLYQKMAEYFNRSHISSLKGWKESASFLMGFIESIVPEKSLFYKDCIIWDWASTARDYRMPAILQDKIYKESRKKVLTYLSSKIKENGPSQYDNIRITDTLIKKAIIVVHHSNQFKENYALNRDFTLFFTENKNNPSLYNINKTNLHLSMCLDL